MVNVFLKVYIFGFLLNKNNMIGLESVFGMMICSVLTTLYSIFRFLDNYKKISNRVPATAFKNIQIFFGMVALCVETYIMTILASQLFLN